MAMSERIESTNFGAINYESKDVLEVPDGVLGFTHLNRFLLIESEDFEPFRFLQSIDEPVICFTLIDPLLVDEGYRLELDSDDQQKLGLEKPDQGLVYSVVTLAEDAQGATANLFAPLVINTANMRGSQIILFNSEYSVNQPLMNN
jgi:flagellar assembly factor FliW